MATLVMQKKSQVHRLQINDVWFFDCPGFDDNISEYKKLKRFNNDRIKY